MLGRSTAWATAYLLVALPAGRAAAQMVIRHVSLYTANAAPPSPLLAQHSAMPLLSAVRLPPSLLLQHAPQNVDAASSGAIGGSSDGSDAPPPRVLGGKADAFGAANVLSIAPYSAARASVAQLGAAPTVAAAVGVTSFPLRATGKLYFKISRVPYVCTASLIKPGLLITAAHCVYEFGRKAGWHTDFVFAPAQYASGQSPPYGTWTATAEFVPDPYRNGRDTCFLAGIVCGNDLAILVMARNGAGSLPGTVLGWYGYGWGGYSSVLSFGASLLTSITQLGYPVAFDGGLMMERNDGIGGLWISGALHNTVLGTPFSGGSSGGPWLVNFGAQPTLDPLHATLGTSSIANVVVGVTSWGYGAAGINTQGSSWFGPNKEFPERSYKDAKSVDRGAGNIGALVSAACSAYPDRC